MIVDPGPLQIRLPKRKKDLPVKKEFEYNPVGSFRDMNPYDMAFCYPHPLYHRPFIVKGGHNDVFKYLKKLNMPMVVHHTYYKRGRHRRFVELYGIDKDIRIQKDLKWSKGLDKYITNKKYLLYKFKVDDQTGRTKRKVLAEFKRIPRRWIRELNLYVTVERRFP